MSLKIKGSYDTEIYPTEGGYVAIKQLDPIDREDRIVLLAARQLPNVLSELQELWEDRESWAASVEREDDQSDATPPAKD